MSELLNEYFKSLRDEIHLRIQEHTRLVWYKIVTLGVMISFLVGICFTTTIGKSLEKILGYVVWIVPLAATVFDILIASNLRVICNLGQYIKNYIEGEAFDEVKDQINESLETKNLFQVGVAEMVPVNNDCILIRILRSFRFFQKRIAPKLSQTLRKEFKNHGFSIKRAKLNEEQNGWRIIDGKRVFIAKKENDYVNIKHPKFGFWEEKAAQAALKYHCYTPLDVLVIWLFTVASGIFPILLLICLEYIECFAACFLIVFMVAILFLPFWLLFRSVTMERRF